jgi:hypothetical protein
MGFHLPHSAQIEEPAKLHESQNIENLRLLLGENG